MNKFNLSLILTLLLTRSCASQSTYETKIARRERNLDHWDAETLAAYLSLDAETAKPLDDDMYTGIDAAVMFYAQWCSNCHSFAPVWDTIGQLVKAGTTESNLILALFNCELNQQHMKLCDAAGVTHYPTLMFIGSGSIIDSDPVTKKVLGKRAFGPYGPTKLARTVKFQGNLNIGDSVLDWIKAMKGLSTWYKWNHMEGGWLKGIRSLFQNPFKKKSLQSKQNALPVGVPGLSVSNLSRGSASSAPISTAKLERDLKSAESLAKEATKQLEDSQLASRHAGYLIDAFLFPQSNEDTDQLFVDVFSEMNATTAWDAKIEDGSNDERLILKSCVVDMTLDYCTRLSTKVATVYLNSLDNVPDTEYPSFAQMEERLRDVIKETEPYCSMFNECFESEFKNIECRPEVCPFQKDGACRYVAACLSEYVKEEYKEALQKDESSSIQNSSSTNTVTTGGNKSTGAGWGV
jgi:thiol-disulfide isomerase/thioredoxin